MAIKERISDEDMILYEILRHPIMSMEFIRSIDLPNDEEIEYEQYQKEMACDFSNTVSYTCGRAIGKTFTLSGLIIWLLINKAFPENYIVYSVPNKVHLSPVWDELIRLLRQNSVLRHFMPKSTGINASDFKITLLNGATLMCRIAGNDNTGRNVVGLHTPFFIIDEANLYEWKSWIELQFTINTFQSGHRLMVSGVPSGMRENNVLYYVDQISDTFTKHHITALQNPRYSEEDHERDLVQYGGIDGEDYKRNVLGQHGTPVSAIFDRALMKINPYPIYRLKFNGIKLSNRIGDYLEKLRTLPSVPVEAKHVIMGVDLGYTDPTAIFILYKNKKGFIKFHARIQLNKVAYPLQTKIIDYLDTKFNPIVIGIDEGSSGISEIQRMKMDETLAYKNYEERIIPIAFQSNIEMGFDNDGEEIVQKVRPFSITLLQEYTNSHRIIYTSTDLEFVSELERMTYMRTPSGNTVYKTLSIHGGSGVGDDHFTSAMLCGILAYYLTEEMLEINPRKRKLAKARWVYTR